MLGGKQDTIEHWTPMYWDHLLIRVCTTVNCAKIIEKWYFIKKWGGNIYWSFRQNPQNATNPANLFCVNLSILPSYEYGLELDWTRKKRQTPI